MADHSLTEIATADRAGSAYRSDVQANDRLPERVTTPRLQLRRWRHDEAGLLGAAVSANLDHLRSFMGWVAQEPLTRLERVMLIEGWTRDWENGGDVILGAFLDGDVVGGSGLHRRAGPEALEIGYWVHGDHVRRGYATEITTALTTTAFGLPDIERVEVHTDEANEASAGIPAKLGFSRERSYEREPQAPGELGRMWVWTMHRPDWHVPGTS